jgi:hypothetical protein
MPARTLAFVLLLLCVPVLAQQPGMGARVNGRMWSDREIRPEPPHSDHQAARLQAIHRDAQELSELQSALQEQLQLLQKGMLHKNLAENLKKTEKLARKLRQEVTP